MEGYIAIIFVVILLGIWIFSIRKAYLTEQEKKTEYKNSEYFLKYKCLILQVTLETGK
mgnify:CR=1 FL=1